MTDPLDDEERRDLLRLARGAIRQALLGGDSLTRLWSSLRLTAGMQARRGAFVSLHAGPEGARKLRGCVGSLAGTAPLHDTVIRVAPRAAQDDPRFPPLLPAELPRIVVEISALTPLCPLSSPDEIVPGLHGVSLTRDAVSAVFLPKVAVEYGWSVEELLRELSRKAGLAADGWRGAELSVFEAETFEEQP